ncbi:MAG: hypothetical protein WCA85_17605 [Paraburkholderia sp.]
MLIQLLLLLIDVVVLVIQNRMVADDPLGRLLRACAVNVSCPRACAEEQAGSQDGAFDLSGVQRQFTLLWSAGQVDEAKIAAEQATLHARLATCLSPCCSKNCAAAHLPQTIDCKLAECFRTVEVVKVSAG